MIERLVRFAGVALRPADAAHDPFPIFGFTSTASFGARKTFPELNGRTI